MGHNRSLGLLALLLVLTDARRVPVHKKAGPHGKVRRQATGDTLSSIAVQATTPPPEVLTTIYPSPGASPVLITEQSQLVTSYVPQYTLCELPPVEFFPVTQTPPTPSSSLAPYLNYSVSIAPGNGSCTTLYTATETMVCATVLSDLTTTHTVSKCAQDITFATEYGFNLVTPAPTPASNATGTYYNASALITAQPSVQTVTTYYLAPWQDLTTAGPPSDVDYKICTAFANDEESCVLEYYKWKTTLLTLSSTVVTSINFTTTIPGPSQLLVETFAANVTGTVTTFSMSTTMELETSTLSETTMVSSRSVITGPTVFETKTVEWAPKSSHRSKVQVTSTTTLLLTRTTHVGTATLTLPSSDSAESILPTDGSTD